MTQEENKTNPKILWVDDTFSNDIHELMAYVDELEDSGFKVTRVDNPDKALEELKKQKEFSCIILDIMLPYGDSIPRGKAQAGNTTGIVLEGMIRRMDRHKDVPIIMLTGVRRQEKIVQDYIKENKDTYFKGGISAEDFREVIKKRISEEPKND